MRNAKNQLMNMSVSQMNEETEKVGRAMRIKESFGYAFIETVDEGEDE